MRVLLLCSRFPWPSFTGDRLRAAIWISALAREHDVTLIAPPGRIPQRAPEFRFEPALPSMQAMLGGALRVAGRAPVQTLLAARYDWNRAIDNAGAFDASIVLLSRLEPLVRDRLDGFRVFDAIDSLGRSMAERAREASPLLRGLWREEARRIGRVEREASRIYDRVVTVSADEAAEFGGQSVANGVAIAPLLHGERKFDFAFWGNLSYFANRDAAAWLLEEIWPAIRARDPRATLLIAGANAPRISGPGVTVQSPFDDIATLARQVRVALFPIRFGTGQSNKVLEAAEAGCAIVATSKAMRGLDPLHAHVRIADDARSLAAAALDARQSHGHALRAAVETHYSRERTLEKLAALLRRAEAAA